jgi:POTRA domain, FtsQ-type
VKRILAGVLVAACALAGGWLWVRDSSLVAVRTITVTGLASDEAPAIRSALRSAAFDMTTLHVREDALRAAVAQYPSVKAVDADADLPHRLMIRVHERAPVLAIDTGAVRVAASSDGLVLRGMTASGLPTLRARSAPAGGRVTDRKTLGALAVAGGAPRELRARIERMWAGSPSISGTARPSSSARGRTPPASGWRPSACWPTRARRAPPISTCGCPNASPPEASDPSRTTPINPSPQTLKLRSRMGRL